MYDYPKGDYSRLYEVKYTIIMNYLSADFYRGFWKESYNLHRCLLNFQLLITKGYHESICP